MTSIECPKERRQTVYVPGSGLIAVPMSRVNEIEQVKAEYHAAETEWAVKAFKTRKVA